MCFKCQRKSQLIMALIEEKRYITMIDVREKSNVATGSLAIVPLINMLHMIDTCIYIYTLHGSASPCKNFVSDFASSVISASPDIFLSITGNSRPLPSAECSLLLPQTTEYSPTTIIAAPIKLCFQCNKQTMSIINITI